MRKYFVCVTWGAPFYFITLIETKNIFWNSPSTTSFSSFMATWMWRVIHLSHPELLDDKSPHQCDQIWRIIGCSLYLGGGVAPGLAIGSSIINWCQMFHPLHISLFTHQASSRIPHFIRRPGKEITFLRCSRRIPANTCSRFQSKTASTKRSDNVCCNILLCELIEYFDVEFEIHPWPMANLIKHLRL